MSPVPESHRVFDDVVDSQDLLAIAQGDERAFAALRLRYAGLLYSVIHRILTDPCDSEEVLQEVMGSLWQRAGQYHPSRGRPVTWLTSAARNRSIDRIRVRRRQARLKEAFSSEILVAARNTAPVSGPEAARRRDTCRAVRSAVLDLTPIQREAIEKIYFEGFTQQEVADRLGEPLGTVKARVRRGLAKLREVIEH